MPDHDIQLIVTRVASEYPQLQISQLKVSHPADDAGLWFITGPGGFEVQIESSTGDFPFLVESIAHNERHSIGDMDATLAVIASELAIWERRQPHDPAG